MTSEAKSEEKVINLQNHELEGEIDCGNPFDVDTVDLLIAIVTSPITNPVFRFPTAVFMSRMRKRFGPDRIKYISTLQDTKIVFIAEASKQCLTEIQAFAGSTLGELARPSGTKLRIKISNLSGCLHQKALRRGLAAYGKVLHLTMRSAQSNGHEAKNENFGTSAVCIIEVHLGKKVPGKLSWLLGGHRVVMPVTLLPLDPPKPKQAVESKPVDAKSAIAPAPALPSAPASFLPPVSVSEPSAAEGKNSQSKAPGGPCVDLSLVSPAEFSCLVEEDQVDKAKEALQRQPDLAAARVVDEDGACFELPLASCTSVAMASLLLEAKADVNAIDSEQESALFRVSNPDIVPLFVTHKIDLTLKNDCGWTALRSWQEHLQDCEPDPEAQREAQTMISALEFEEQNAGWSLVQPNAKKRSRSRSSPRSDSPLAQGRAAGEA